MGIYGKKFVDLACPYVGTRESPLGSNRSPIIDVWNRNVGVPAGSYWCASFTSAIQRKFTEEVGITHPLPFTASCDVYLNFARKKRILNTEPEVGRLFLLLDPNDANDAFHVGMVAGKGDDGVWESIEGNSNSGGSRNGIEVAYRKSLFSGRSKIPIRFIDWESLIEDDVDGSIWTLVIGERNFTCVNMDGRVFAPFRDVAAFLHGDVKSRISFDGKPFFDDRPIPMDWIMVQGSTFVSVRDTAKWAGLSMSVDSTNRTITLSR